MSDEQNQELKQKVDKWLTKEGYSLEFLTATAFKKAGFSVKQGQYVRDSTNDTVREIDVSATFEKYSTEANIIRIYHVIECKWSMDKPWVIFSTENSIQPGACIAQSFASELGKNLLWLSANDEDLHNCHHFDTPARPGFSGRQAFGDGKDLFYNAMQSVTSTTSLLVKEYDNPTLPFLIPKIAVVAFPVIVLKGQLFEAHYDEIRERIELEQVSKMRLHWRGSESWVNNATVDIITSDHLQSFANKRASEIDRILYSLEASHKIIRDCHSERSLKPLKEAGTTDMNNLPSLLYNIKMFQNNGQNE